jgi:peptide/nickel transport system ATP-binding protein
MSDQILDVKNLHVQYKVAGGRTLHAVSDVSFTVQRGETLGIVGESGCGKSSLIRAIAQLPRPTLGDVILDGTSLTALQDEELRRARMGFPIVFQDPASSLNPRRRVVDLVAQPLKIQGLGNKDERSERAAEILKRVGIGSELFHRHPYEMSGGQCQRVSIARALVTNPSLLICDEPVSALDVSVQAQILNLLEDLRSEFNISILFVSHDLGVVRNVSDRVLVMYLGKVAEIGDSESLYESPGHPYTKLLLDSIPDPGKRRELPVQRTGIDLPSPLDPPSGCRFRTRCPLAIGQCEVEQPELRLIGTSQEVACHLSSVQSAQA